MLDIIKAYAVNNLCYITAQEMIPQGIVVHSTGANNPCLKRYVDSPESVGVNRYGNHWNVAKPGGRMACVHSFIGYDKNDEVKVAEILPHNICCWGVGAIPYDKYGNELTSENDPRFHHYGPSYNYDPAYIQFEICEDDLTDKTYYKKVFEVAAQYCAYLCIAYEISVDKIVGHCEAYRLGYGCNHADPEHWMKRFGESMDDFRKKVSKILKNNNGKRENAEETLKMEETIENGDLVSIVGNATYYNGKNIPLWVKAQNWYVRGTPQGDRVVIDKNEKGTNFICSPIHKKYIAIVEKAGNNTTKEETHDGFAKCPYLVKVITKKLVIHKQAGANTEVVGVIRDSGVYTIVEEKKDGNLIWGRLKSGAGWISLDQVRKL